MKIFNECKWQQLFLLIVLIFNIDLPIQGQNKDESELSKSAANKLRQKVLLTDDQTKKVENILAEYIKSKSPEEQNSANKKIVVLLDEKQKAKFEIIKDDWWNELNRALKDH